MAPRREAPVASFVGRAPDLDRVRRVLLIRLRSIGDTVLMTPCVSALKRWRPDLTIDVALEPFCAPLVRHHPDVDRVVEVDRSFGARVQAGLAFRHAGYDLTVNLNGGTTAALLALASGAPVRVGFAGYQQAWLANCRVTSSHDVWRRTDVHTVEHQLALLAGIGVPVDEPGDTWLRSSKGAAELVAARLRDLNLQPGDYAVLHPEASAEAKRWPEARFASLARTLFERFGMRAIVVGKDPAIVAAAAGDVGIAMPDLTLDETMALVEGAGFFVGNDSGPAHIAAAYTKPTVVIFGPSNTELWRPWTRAPWRIVRGETASDVSEAQVVEAIESIFES